MKTFDELKPGDKIWFGKNPEPKTICAISPTPKNGKFFQFEKKEKDIFHDMIEVGPSSLQKTQHHRNGNPNAKFFSCQEATIQNEIDRFETKIRDNENKIKNIKSEIEAYQANIRFLREQLIQFDKTND